MTHIKDRDVQTAAELAALGIIPVALERGVGVGGNYSHNLTQTNDYFQHHRHQQHQHC